jgi:hypothetical protein
MFQLCIHLENKIALILDIHSTSIFYTLCIHYFHIAFVRYSNFRSYKLLSALESSSSYRKSNKMHLFIYIYSKLSVFYMFRTDTPFIIRSLRIAVHAAVLVMTSCSALPVDTGKGETRGAYLVLVGKTAKETNCKT